MPEILDWRRIAKPRYAARLVASYLRKDALLAFPTESAFVVTAQALSTEAVKRVQEIVGARPLEVFLPSASAARDWLPQLGSAGRCVIKRLWPGPVTILSREGAGDGLASRLPALVRDAITAEDGLYLRQVGHEILHAVLKRLPLPLLGATIPSREMDAFSVRQVIEATGNRLDLVLHGEGQFQVTPTLVEVRGREWTIRREGVITPAQLRQELACVVVFVCTGNTCRSPMAEALFKKRLADRLQCQITELEDRGYRILSAGMAASSGWPAAERAVEVARTFGADLTQHESQPLTLEVVSRADHLLVMTSGHLQSLEPQMPRGATRPRLLSPNGDDVDDPVGGSREVYEACAKQLDDYLGTLVDQFVRS